MTEQWANVPGCEGQYMVSDQGRVLTLARPNVPKPRLLRPSLERAGGHLVVNISWQGKQRPVGVHRLVLLAFAGLPEAGYEACHRNGEPTDNQLSNLYWGTRSDNVQDCIAHGMHHYAKRDACKHGHEFTEENTLIRITPLGHTARVCRQCAKDRLVKFHAKKKELRDVV